MTLDRRKSGPSRIPFDPACIVKRFDAPEHALAVDNGRLEGITVGGRVIGKGSYGPGWSWSKAANATSPGDRRFDHVGVVLSGHAKVAISEGEFDLIPGDFFHVAGDLDLWVIHGAGRTGVWPSRSGAATVEGRGVPRGAAQG